MNSAAFPLLSSALLLLSALSPPAIVESRPPQINGILPKRRSQVYPLQLLEDEKEQMADKERQNRWFADEEEEENDGDDGDVLDEEGRFELSGRGGAERDGPSAAFWSNALGPFLFVFENKDRRNSRTMWRLTIRKLNRMRRDRLGKDFAQLAWDNQLTNKVRQISFTELRPLSVVIKNPVNGVASNLILGFQTLFSAFIWQNVLCSRGGACRVAPSKRRIPAELADSKARRIGCNARVYKEADKRELRFAAVCATERSAGEGQNGTLLNLFRLSELQNVRLKKKLRWEAVDSFEKGEEGGEDEAAVDDDDDDDDEEANGKPLAKNVQPKASPVSVHSGDIVRVRADAIVDPVKGSLFAALLQSPVEEAVDRVLGAESVLDVLEMDEEDGLGKTMVRRQLRRLTELVDPTGNGTALKKAAKDRAARAKQQLEHWLQALKVPQTFAALQAEVDAWRQRKNVSAGADQRILVGGGPALKEKLRELAQRRGGGGALVPGDAVATDAFEISDKFFAKTIIHTVPPSELITQRDFEKLADCFRRSLEVTVSRGFSSVAFPEMMARNASDKVKEQAARIGVDAVAKWLSEHPNGKVSIILVVYNNPRMFKQYKQLVEEKFPNKN
uniref:Macro domain-containing protein n=1 Tax=Globodera rostochiensis TaxID=31243 RepID=A0A914HBM6_GLORO